MADAIADAMAQAIANYYANWTNALNATNATERDAAFALADATNKGDESMYCPTGTGRELGNGTESQNSKGNANDYYYSYQASTGGMTDAYTGWPPQSSYYGTGMENWFRGHEPSKIPNVIVYGNGWKGGVELGSLYRSYAPSEVLDDKFMEFLGIFGATKNGTWDGLIGELTGLVPGLKAEINKIEDDGSLRYFPTNINGVFRTQKLGTDGLYHPAYFIVDPNDPLLVIPIDKPNGVW
jgi:hypothetical protein